MLGIFHQAFVHAPQELCSPDPSSGVKDGRNPSNPDEILQGFLSSLPQNSVSLSFGSSSALAYHQPGGHFSIHRRLFCGMDDVYCIFYGNLNNLCTLIKQYGLAKSSNEPMVVIEAYRTLRDRGPYPIDQVVKDFDGSFAFILFDSNNTVVFTALGADGKVQLYWGVAAEGSIVISDNQEVIKAGCGRSFAPFPTGCLFHTERGLMSFEHPMNKMTATRRVDSEGIACGVVFKVDKYSRVNSMPRVGSDANWASLNY